MIPEERQPLASILLGDGSGTHEFAVALVDTGCTAEQVCTKETMDYLVKHHPHAIYHLRRLEEPAEIKACSEGEKPKITHEMGVRFRYVSSTGELSREISQMADVIEGGNTGG